MPPRPCGHIPKPRSCVPGGQPAIPNPYQDIAREQVKIKTRGRVEGGAPFAGWRCNPESAGGELHEEVQGTHALLRTRQDFTQSQAEVDAAQQMVPGDLNFETACVEQSLLSA